MLTETTDCSVDIVAMRASNDSTEDIFKAVVTDSCSRGGYCGRIDLDDSVDTEEELIKHDRMEHRNKKRRSRKVNGVKHKGYHEIKMREDDSTQGEDTPVHVASDPIKVCDEPLRKSNTFEKFEEKGHPNGEEFMLQHIVDSKHKALAPPLPARFKFHVVFICHSNDLAKLSKVTEKLESAPFGFSCACFHQDARSRMSLLRTVHCALKTALKTVMVITEDFLSEVWHRSDMTLLTDMDITLSHRDLLLLHCAQAMDIPKALNDLCRIIAHGNQQWMTSLLVQLCSVSVDSPLSEGVDPSISSSMVGISPTLQSGQLLLSVKSQCGYCGKELVDSTDVPEELAQHGIHVPVDEYHRAISHLMSDHKFLCHVWCYNVPAAIAFFGLLLCLCLSVIPLIEIHLIVKHSTQTGLEFVHGGIVWLCGLTVYMVTIYISKKKMKQNTYKRLAVVNTILVKYNILTGVENLGLADCNKYYLHFFYIEVGPCIAYLEELMMTLSEHSELGHNLMEESVAIAIEEDEECKVSKSLVGKDLTNATRQLQVEQLLLQHSGEFISLIITKKLVPPAKPRHMRPAPCLCQFLESKLYQLLTD